MSLKQKRRVSPTETTAVSKSHRSPCEKENKKKGVCVRESERVNVRPPRWKKEEKKRDKNLVLGMGGAGRRNTAWSHVSL
jgi:hypothetical protein